jgi:hypothetical protein
MAQLEEDLAKELCELIRQHVAVVTKTLRDKIEVLERKVVELQTKGVDYRGVYQRACSYELGAIVTSDGSMWACVQNVGPNTQPGQSQGWQLCCRAGRDGKDGKNATAPR